MTRATPIPNTVTPAGSFRMVKLGGRKEMQLPAGASLPRQAGNALARAFGSRIPRRSAASLRRPFLHRAA